MLNKPLSNKADKQNERQKYYPIKQEQFVHRAQLELLRQKNLEYFHKEQVYLEKLMKLEQGLQKQYIQFMTLQQLYTQLLQSYKNKQQQINHLQQLYRQTQRKKNQQQQNSRQDIYKYQKLKTQYQKIFTNYYNLRQDHKKITTQLLYFKSKQKMNDSRTTLQSKVIEQLQQWQKLLDEEKQDKIKLQYENKFLKNRNEDLEKCRDDLERLLENKQKQVIRLRTQKIYLHRDVYEKRLQRSRSRSRVSVATTRNSKLKQIRKQSPRKQKQINDSNNSFKSKQSSYELKNSPKHINYFSFKQNFSSKECNQLPTFPPELQINNLINEYKKQ